MRWPQAGRPTGVGALMRQPRRKNVVSCQDIFYSFHDIFYRLGVSRRNDLEAAIAFGTTPKMNNVPLISKLAPFGKGSSLLRWTHVIANLERRSDAILIVNPSFFGTTYRREVTDLWQSNSLQPHSFDPHDRNPSASASDASYSSEPHASSRPLVKVRSASASRSASECHVVLIEPQMNAYVPPVRL